VSQCKTPNASEAKFIKAVNETHGRSGMLASTRGYKLREEEAFVVRHFAGEVAYHTSAIVGKKTKQAEVGWLEKNNDQMSASWVLKLASSSVPLLAEMFGAELTRAAGV
jgi:myosin heavy subunit